MQRQQADSPIAGMATLGTRLAQESCFRYMRAKALSTPQAARPSITFGIMVSIAAPMNCSLPSPLRKHRTCLGGVQIAAWAQSCKTL